MPTPPRHGKAQLDQRRDIIRSLLARGINKPGRILKQQAVQGMYEGYVNKYVVVKSDIKAVRKENIEIAKAFDKESVHGEYIVQLEELLQQAWSDYGKLDGNSKVSMLKFIRELGKDWARLNGIDPDRIDRPLFNVNVDVDNTSEIGLSPELREDVKEFSKAFDAVAEMFQSEVGTVPQGTGQDAIIGEDLSEDSD